MNPTNTNLLHEREGLAAFKYAFTNPLVKTFVVLVFFSFEGKLQEWLFDGKPPFYIEDAFSSEVVSLYLFSIFLGLAALWEMRTRAGFLLNLFNALFAWFVAQGIANGNPTLLVFAPVSANVAWGYFVLTLICSVVVFLVYMAHIAKMFGANRVFEPFAWYPCYEGSPYYPNGKANKAVKSLAGARNADPVVTAPYVANTVSASRQAAVPACHAKPDHSALRPAKSVAPLSREVVKKPASRASASHAYQFQAVQPRFGFERVEGMATVKAQLVEIGERVIECLRRGDMEALAASQNGILLSSDPGNGKTLIAEAFAGHLGVGFIKVSIKDVDSQYLGKGTENIATMLKDATEQAPCVLFIDEADSLLPNRHDRMHEDQKSRVNAMLAGIDDARAAGVIFVAATNFRDGIDGAIRKGRLDLEVRIPSPDFAARLGFLRTRIAAQGIYADDDAVRAFAEAFDGISMAALDHLTKVIRDEQGKTGAKVGFNELMQAVMIARGNQGVAIPENMPSVDDLVLSEPFKRVMHPMIRPMLEMESAFKRGIKVPAGLLLHGPSRTGKTLLVRMLAKLSGWSLFETNGRAVMADPDAFDKLIAKAKQARPAIVCVDKAEFALSDEGVINSKLLSLLEGENGAAYLTVIAVTNRPELLSESVRNNSRLNTLEFELPDADALTVYANKLLAGYRGRVDLDVTAPWLAQAFTGGALEDMRIAIENAWRLHMDGGLIGRDEIVVS